MSDEGLPPLVFDCDGVFRSLGRDRHTGRELEVAFVPGVGMVERRTIPERALTRELDENRRLANARPVGTMALSRGMNAIKVATVPGPIRALWTSVLGPFHTNKEAWLKRMRDPDNRRFLTSGYKP
jgi:hypothetical protein